MIDSRDDCVDSLVMVPNWVMCGTVALVASVNYA
eukprot:SAG31_NODE_37106_length_307_cov_0.750000_1_plen_33_part_10